MSVVFITFESIEIDGTLAGNIVDVISNHAPRRAEVLAAFNLFTDKLRTALELEKTQLVSDHTTAIEKLNQDHAIAIGVANRTIDQLQSRVTFLESIKPFNDGLIKIESFMERCKPYMSRLMFAANDEIPANGFGNIVSLLNAKVKIGEPVNMNSATFGWAIDMIRTLNDVTEEEIAILTRPASREEAFIEASEE
jgi:hypothetical protein